jgi:hypothetical protein
MTDDRYERLAKRRDESPIPWVPEKPGDELYGTITELGETETKHGTFPYVDVKTGDGPRRYVVSQTIPRRQLEEQQPVVGDGILAYFKDLTEPKGNNNPAKIIDVFIDRLNAESDGRVIDPWASAPVEPGEPEAPETHPEDDQPV